MQFVNTSHGCRNCCCLQSRSDLMSLMTMQYSKRFYPMQFVNTSHGCKPHEVFIHVHELDADRIDAALLGQLDSVPPDTQHQWHHRISASSPLREPQFDVLLHLGHHGCRMDAMHCVPRQIRPMQRTLAIRHLHSLQLPHLRTAHITGIRIFYYITGLHHHHLHINRFTLVYLWFTPPVLAHKQVYTNICMVYTTTTCTQTGVHCYMYGLHHHYMHTNMRTGQI